MGKFHIHSLSRRGYRHSLVWSVVLSLVIVIAAATLGRAARNFRAALTEKPDVAIYLLLPNEGLERTSLLRENENERDYLAETSEGQKLIKLKRENGEWAVALIEPLRENE